MKLYLIIFIADLTAVNIILSHFRVKTIIQIKQTNMFLLKAKHSAINFLFYLSKV